MKIIATGSRSWLVEYEIDGEQYSHMVLAVDELDCRKKTWNHAEENHRFDVHEFKFLKLYDFANDRVYIPLGGMRVADST